jgi:hypothetical protein
VAGERKATSLTITLMMSANDTYVPDVAQSFPLLALARVYPRWFLLKRHIKILVALKIQDAGHADFDYMLNSGTVMIVPPGAKRVA